MCGTFVFFFSRTCFMSISLLTCSSIQKYFIVNSLKVFRIKHIIRRVGNTLIKNRISEKHLYDRLIETMIRVQSGIMFGPTEYHTEICVCMKTA